MTFRPAKPETLERHRRERQVQRETQRLDLDARMLAAYNAEPDREYAKIMWGDRLRERGVLAR